MSNNTETEKIIKKYVDITNSTKKEDRNIFKDYCDSIGKELGVISPINDSDVQKYDDIKCFKETKEAYYLSFISLLSTVFMIKFPTIGMGGVLALTVIGAMALNRSDLSLRDYQKIYNERITEVAGVTILGSILTLLTGNEWPLLISFYIGLYRSIDGFMGFINEDSERKTTIIEKQIKKALSVEKNENINTTENEEISKPKYDI